MLETDIAELIAQGQQQIVVIEVSRPEQRVGFLDQLAMRRELFGLDLQARHRVRHDIQAHDRITRGL